MTLFLCKLFSNLMAGILPFGAVFIELFFILSVSKLDFSIKKYIFVGPEKILKLLFIEKVNIAQWAIFLLIYFHTL